MKEWIAINSDSQAHTIYPFSPDLISNRMKELLTADNAEINKILDYLTQNNGKMIRPRMVFICASMAAHDPVVVRDIAAAVEMIHLASLVHDDVIDHAVIRRGRQSVNSRWGNQASVLTGDYLFASAFNLINKYDMQAVMENVTTTIRIMCAGEIKQMSLVHDLNITEEEYLEKTYGKTACLFASSCKVGAQAAFVPEQHVHALEQYGLCLGYAYQIMDDLLDFLSDSSMVGKPVGSDLIEGNITLPVIYALKSLEYGTWLRTLLEARQLTPRKMPHVIKALINSQAADKSLDLACQFVSQAMGYLDILPYSPAITELQLLAAHMLETYYQQTNHRQTNLKHPAIFQEASRHESFSS